MLKKSVETTLSGLKDAILQLNNEAYITPCESLSGATIGQHTRHIIELFECLLAHYESGTVNYDARKRNPLIENNIEQAMVAIDAIISGLDFPDKELKLIGEMGEFHSNFNRELLYNLEHCIHHQALIKVAFLQFESLALPVEFGVAPSTLKYRKQCAQ